MSKASDRKFRRERERHYAAVRQLEAEKAEARLKGFRPVTAAEMTKAILGLPAGPLEPSGNRAQRRGR